MTAAMKKLLKDKGQCALAEFLKKKYVEEQAKAKAKGVKAAAGNAKRTTRASLSRERSLTCLAWPLGRWQRPQQLLTLSSASKPPATSIGPCNVRSCTV